MEQNANADDEPCASSTTALRRICTRNFTAYRFTKMSSTPDIQDLPREPRPAFP